MQNLSGLVCAVTRSAGTDSVALVAKCVGLVNVLRHSGYIVQPFVLGRDETVCIDMLQRISGRRVVALEPWLHAGSTLQHVFWNACEGSDVAVFLIPEGVLEASSFELPSWSGISELLVKLKCPVLLCTSVQDSLENIHDAAKILSPDLLLHMSANQEYPHCVAAGAALKAAQAEHADCRLLGLLPEAPFEAAVDTLHSQQASAEPLRAVVSAAIKHRTLVSVMGRARLHDQIPQPTQATMHLTHRHSGVNRVRIAVGVDMGLSPSQFHGNLNVLESLGCELTNVSMVSATCLPPDVSGLYLSASLTPEAAYSLSVNVSMRMSVAAFAAAGGVIYAEEAGLAYLASSVRVGAETFGMAGVLPMHVIMHEDKQVHSYVRLRVQPPPGKQEPLLQPHEWLRGVADTTLEVREEVTTRGLGVRTHHMGDMKVSQLFDAVLVDVSPPKQGSGDVSASPVHGFDTVGEGYMQSKVAATLVHVCFASQASALQPLVATCAALDPRQLASLAAQHIAISQRSSSSSRTSPSRLSKPQSHLQSGSEGCLTQLNHPLTRLRHEHSNTPPSPHGLTSCGSTVSMDFNLSPGLDAVTASAQGHGITQQGTRRSLHASASPGHPAVSASGRHCDTESSARDWVAARDLTAVSGGAQQRQRGWGGGLTPQWGSIPESLFRGQPSASGSGAAHSHHNGAGNGGQSTMRSAAQWWVPPQPLPRARVLSGRDLTVFDGVSRPPVGTGHKASRSCGAEFTPTSLQNCTTRRSSSEERQDRPSAAPVATDASGLTKTQSSSSSSSHHSMPLSERLERSTSSHCTQSGVRGQIAALSPSIVDILHHFGLSSAVGGVPAGCNPTYAPHNAKHHLHMHDRERSGVRSLARTSAGSAGSPAPNPVAQRTVISLAADLTGGLPDAPCTHNHNQKHHVHAPTPTQKIATQQQKQQQKKSKDKGAHHRRVLSPGDMKLCPGGSWRQVSWRVIMNDMDWQPLHTVHTEQIAALVAPMVLTWEPERCFCAGRGGVLPVAEAAHVAVLDHLRNMHAPVDIVTLPAPRSIADMYSIMQCMGTILRMPGAAESTAQQMRAGLHRLAQLCFQPGPSSEPSPRTTTPACDAAAPRQRQRRVAVLRSAAPYIAAGGWVPELVRMSGCTYPWVFPGEGSLEIQWSDVVAQQPDVIIVAVEIVGVEAAAVELAALAEEPGWWNLTATRNREVYVVDAAHLLQVGPGVVQAAETMVRICRGGLRELLGDAVAGPGDRYRDKGSNRVLKLEMTAAQRCRPSLLPSFFEAVPW